MVLIAYGVDCLLRCYSEDGLGYCHKLKVHLTLKADAQPKFCKCRLPPFFDQGSNRARSGEIGVLQSIKHSEWTTLTVVVPKPSKAVRICGDFSVTVNPQTPRFEQLLQY